MTTNIKIRAIDKSEFRLLEDFLYEAIFIPAGHKKPEKEIIRLPELNIYFKDFGKEDDICFVAELGDEITGAIWTRVFSETEPGYGFIDSKTPELCMSVLPEYQQQGIGTKLLEFMLSALKDSGYEQLSLSVDIINYALSMYQKFGFEKLKTVEGSATMIKRLNSIQH